MSDDVVGGGDGPAEGARLAEVLRRVLLGDGPEEVGPNVRAYLEAAIGRLEEDGEVTLEAGPLEEALVADSPDVARLDDYRDEGR